MMWFDWSKQWYANVCCSSRSGCVCLKWIVPSTGCGSVHPGRTAPSAAAPAVARRNSLRVDVGIIELRCGKTRLNIGAMKEDGHDGLTGSRTLLAALDWLPTSMANYSHQSAVSSLFSLGG